MPHGDTPAWSRPDHPPAAPDPTTGGSADRPDLRIPHEGDPLPGAAPTGDRSAPGPRRTGHHGDLRRLRRTYRIQRRTTTFLALGYFTAFLVLSALRPSFMTRPVVGGLPAGLVLALSHIPVTWLAVLVYERTARRFVDPLALRVTRHTPWAAGPGQEQGR